MIDVIEIPNWDAMELYSLLEEHGLVSGAIKRDPTSLAGLAKSAKFYAWIRNDDPMAVMLEVPSPEPGILELLLVPMDRELGKTYRTEVAEMSPALRERWFASYRRVQAMIPASRVNMQRCMKALGFLEETRHGMGLRGMVQLGGGSPEAMIAFGLLESDPLKVYGERPDKAEFAELTINA